MKVRVQVVIEAEGSEQEVIQEVACLERAALRPEELGMTLEEAKSLLGCVQQTMVTEQVKEFIAQSRCCRSCGQVRRRKGKHEIVYRTLFGKLKLASPRLYECSCQQGEGRQSMGPLAELLRERTSPELLYLETKFAALMSYGLTVELLGEVLPLSKLISVSSLHRQVQRVGERMEGELGEEQMFFIEGCERDWAELPRPEMPLVVGLDGG